LPNPHYTPEIMAKTTIINFSITMDGLEEQLLNEVVRFEYPSIEETRKSLVENMNKNKITLKKCEDDLLNALNESAGTDILENTKLIETLKNTKDKAQELKGSLEASETTKKDLYLKRADYIPVAKRGAILYFTICGLRLISSMYEYSLASYIGVYRNAIKEAPPNMILTNRLDSIKKKLTNLLYDYICLSIFGKHKLMFSFHMRTMIMRYEEELNMNELLFFLRGNIEESKNEKPAELEWVSDTTWQDLEGMGKINDTMFKVQKKFNENVDEWKNWYDLEKPEDVELPSGLESELTPLEKLLVIRVFRKDRVYNAIKNFIKITTGSETFITPTPMKMSKIFEQSSEGTPVLFILSPGVDPSYFVNQYAIEKGYFEKKYRFMSLGQKQETEAKNMIMDGIKRGLWILLQNCDLLFKWLKELENIIDSIESMKPKSEFRLWLTTSPIENFPIGILHKSFKVVTEPPDGLGPNMNRVFGSMKAESFESESSHQAYKPLVFVISFFHSVLQDRKKFGKIGWNVIYDFMESDFTISKRLLAMYLNKIGPDDMIPWASLKYLIGEAMYGGRVTDDYDRRVMMTYLNEYMGDFIFDVNQKFFFARAENFDYEIPELGPFDNYVKAITEMPITYSPEIIGLHSNAEIDYFTQASKRIWEDMIKLQSSTGDSGSQKKDENTAPVKTREEIVLGMAEMFIDKKVPPKFDMLAVNKKFSAGKSPIEAVLTQELERYNMLNDCMNETLSDLISSLKGEIAMNAEIESIMLSIYNGLLPDQWRKLAPETQKSLLNWIEHYRHRYEQYQDWLDNGEPKTMWLSGLHIPASYLKAIIQITCRKKGWPLDKVSTYTVVTKIYNVDEIKEKPEFGCYIQGLYLEGAEWNTEKNCLERQLPKKLICDMPLIQVIPAEASKIKLRNNLKTPVYVTQNRKNVKGEGFVFEADLRTLIHPNLWILQGVALLLNTMYG
jgi:dynein heavy chain